MAIARTRRRRSATPALSLRRVLLPLAAALLLHLSHGRPISPSDLVSDGLATGARLGFPGFLRMGSAEAACEQTYGFMPCTQTALGNLFLLIVYGYLMFTAATYLSDGSEMLLQILGPGIVGGLFLPVLGALPDAILILVSGLSGTKEVAQQKVLIGMGLLAGSTVMILTLLWGSCVVLGKADLPGRSTESENSNSFLDTGISTDVQTSYAARIMIISIIPFIIIQSPKIFKFYSGGHWIVLVTLIVAVALLISYCLYQVYQPWIQKRRLAYAKRKHVMSGFLRHMHQQSLGRFLNSDGSLNEDVLIKLFKRIDEDDNGLISRPELRTLIIAIQFDVTNLDSNEAVDKVMDDFDTSRDDHIDINEFVRGIKKYLDIAKSSVPNAGPYSKKFLHDFHNKTREEHDMLDTSDEDVEKIDNPTLETIKALLYLLAGTVIALAFADPLVDAVNNFSNATKIPSFFISFIAMPLATNSSEAVSALIFASRKKQRTASLAFSEIYGAVTMNNTLCLAVFLALVYVRQLTWDFSSEVLIILIVCVVMGLFASFKTTFPLWTCFIAYLLYPFSLVLVYVLDYIYGWS